MTKIIREGSWKEMLGGILVVIAVGGFLFLLFYPDITLVDRIIALEQELDIWCEQQGYEEGKFLPSPFILIMRCQRLDSDTQIIETRNVCTYENRFAWCGREIIDLDATLNINWSCNLTGDSNISSWDCDIQYPKLEGSL